MAAESIMFHKSNRAVGGVALANTVAGFEESTWTIAGQGGALPVGLINPTNATAGGIMQTDPAGGGVQKWLTSMVATYRMSGRLVVYDRLLQMGGFSGTDVALKNLNGGSPATLTRHYLNALGNTDDGNEIFFEVGTVIGVTPQTATVNYTNSAGAAQSGTATVGGTNANIATRISRVQLAAGDTGVQSVTSFQLGGSTGTAGNFAIVVAHRLLEIEISSVGGPEVWSGIDGQFKEILAGACLAFTFLPGGASTANAVTMWAMMNFADV